MSDPGSAPTSPIAGGTKEPVHVVLVGTKPDIIKQAPVFHELASRGHRTLVCHTGQHFDHNLSGAMLDEFAIERHVNLGVSGSAVDLASNITARLGSYLDWLAEEVGPPITYVHGDTTTAMAGALAGFSAGHGVVHVEAGLRTLSPRPEILREWLDQLERGDLDWARYREQSAARETYERGSREPSPEQFNTKVADAAANLHAAPVELNRDYLLGEGFSPRSIDVVGNSVVDALEHASTDRDRQGLLEKYPQLSSGEFIRFCVHRKENTSDEGRFRALMGAMEGLLETGHSVLFIRLNGTEQAIDRFGHRAWLDGLQARFGQRFITSGVWPNYGHVLEAMRMCAAVATDSGSIQEEVNVLGVPCVTLRFGSDRAESLLAGGNFLAPPVSVASVVGVVTAVVEHRNELSWSRVYPPKASALLVDAVERHLTESGRLQSTEEWRYGLG